MYKIRIFLAVLTLFGGSVFAQLPYPLPAPQDTAHLGKFIQRTMKLLSGSTPAKRNTVKILVYGQSISEQAWSDSVKAFLIKKYPYANIIMINRAIGGYASQELKKPTYHDVPSFYPDLVIFHVYGSHFDLDSIMNTIRRTTTAEVLFQNSHVTHNDSASGSWENTYGYTYIPEIATRYGLEFCDVRTQWYKYLQTNNKRADDLTIDGTHLNDQGNFLMARLIERYLFDNPRYTADTFKLVKTYTIGTDVQWVNGKLKLPFSGNRVDLIADAPVPDMDSALVRIDDKKPSETQGTRMFYLANLPFNTDWKIGNAWGFGGPMRVFSQAPLLDETWIMTITGKTFSGGAYTINFSVGGSKTGFDGSGSVMYTNSFSGSQFVSNSKRMIINAADWFVFFDNTNYNVGKTFTWQVLRFAKDSYVPPTSVDPALENISTVAQGITNSTHILELTAQGNKNVPIKAIRVYEPNLLRSETAVPLLTVTAPANGWCSNKPFDLTKAVIEKTTMTGPLTYWYDEFASMQILTPTSVEVPGVYYVQKTTLTDNRSQLVSLSITSVNCVPNLSVTGLGIVCNTEADLTKLVNETTGVSLKELSFYSDSLLTQKITNPENVSLATPPKKFYVRAVSDSNFSVVKAIPVYVSIPFVPCSTTTGIAKMQASLFKLYPNPTNGLLYIEMEDIEDADLEITDLIGNSVYKRKIETGRFEIDLRSHPEGIYLARLRTQGKTSVQKIILH